MIFFVFVILLSPYLYLYISSNLILFTSIFISKKKSELYTLGVYHSSFIPSICFEIATSLRSSQ